MSCGCQGCECGLGKLLTLPSKCKRGSPHRAPRSDDGRMQSCYKAGVYIERRSRIDRDGTSIAAPPLSTVPAPRLSRTKANDMVRHKFVTFATITSIRSETARTWCYALGHRHDG